MSACNTVYQLIEARAQHTPETIAFVSPKREPITYRRLLHEVDLISKSLGEIGIERHHRIAIVLPNGLEMAVVFVGVSCAAISVPLNPAYLENEFGYYLSDVHA